MMKRLVSLLLAAMLCCSLFCCALAEKDKYQEFVDKYGPDYEEIDWEQALAEMGGLDAVDWKTLVHAVGYEGDKKIGWTSLIQIIGADAFFGDGIWSSISEAEEEVAEEYFADASDLVRKFCTNRMMEKYPLDTLDEFLDLALNRLIPQSVGLLVSRIPAFRNAPAGSFSSGIGLSISTSISNDTFAIAGIQPNGEYSIRMQITLYLEKWLEKTGDGGYVLRRDGQTAAELNHVIIHELFHCFMFDYNRNGEVFFRPASYSYDDFYAHRDASLYPSWFQEGAAVLLAGGYRFFDAVNQWLGFVDPESTALVCTPDLVRQVYTKLVKNLDADKNGDNYYASYQFGPLAVAWLCDRQWQSDGHPSAISHGADGIPTVNGEGMLNGFSRILERLHNGESLDDIIRRVSQARFLDTEDFSKRFIQGGAGGSDEGTAAFYADWMNAMAALSRQKGYTVTGSLLTGLGTHAEDTLDWNRTATAALYVPLEKSYIQSDAAADAVIPTAGKSAFGIEAWREGAKYICAEGADGVYVKGSGAPLAFTFERTVNGESAFSHFTALEVNGGVLNPGSQYTAASGSVKAELLPAYPDTLAPGTYKLTAVFDDEKAVTVNFTVQAKPGSFEAVAVPSDTFSFKVAWEGGSENSIDFTLYKSDGSVYHHGFDKKAVSPTEWRYNAWFSEAVACYVIEKPVEGYKTRYENVGVYVGITDRCCDGGTIVNYRVPKTGDEAPILLWLGCVLGGMTVMILAVRSGKRKKAHSR